eukprot:3207524-Pyramimonas_sp.AAC.1
MHRHSHHRSSCVGAERVAGPEDYGVSPVRRAVSGRRSADRAGPDQRPCQLRGVGRRDPRRYVL